MGQNVIHCSPVSFKLLYPILLPEIKHTWSLLAHKVLFGGTCETIVLRCRLLLRLLLSAIVDMKWSKSRIWSSLFAQSATLLDELRKFSMHRELVPINMLKFLCRLVVLLLRRYEYIVDNLSTLLSLLHLDCHENFGLTLIKISLVSFCFKRTQQASPLSNRIVVEFFGIPVNIQWFIVVFLWV